MAPSIKHFFTSFKRAISSSFSRQKKLNPFNGRAKMEFERFKVNVELQELDEKEKLSSSIDTLYYERRVDVNVGEETVSLSFDGLDEDELQTVHITSFVVGEDATVLYANNQAAKNAKMWEEETGKEAKVKEKEEFVGQNMFSFITDEKHRKQFAHILHAALSGKRLFSYIDAKKKDELPCDSASFAKNAVFYLPTSFNGKKALLLLSVNFTFAISAKKRKLLLKLKRSKRRLIYIRPKSRASFANLYEKRHMGSIRESSMLALSTVFNGFLQPLLEPLSSASTYNPDASSDEPCTCYEKGLSLSLPLTATNADYPQEDWDRDGGDTPSVSFQPKRNMQQNTKQRMKQREKQRLDIITSSTFAYKQSETPMKARLDMREGMKKVLEKQSPSEKAKEKSTTVVSSHASNMNLESVKNAYKGKKRKRTLRRETEVHSAYKTELEEGGKLAVLTPHANHMPRHTATVYTALASEPLKPRADGGKAYAEDDDGASYIELRLITLKAYFYGRDYGKL